MKDKYTLSLTIRAHKRGLMNEEETIKFIEEQLNKELLSARLAFISMAIITIGLAYLSFTNLI